MSKLGVRGVSIPGMLGSTLEPRGPNVLPLFEFDLADSVFTPAMAIRPMDTFYSPIFQGDWDGTGTPDVVTFPREDLLGNQTQFRYANFDPYQGSISFWITPEWNGNDGLQHGILDARQTLGLQLYKSTANTLILVVNGLSLIHI